MIPLSDKLVGGLAAQLGDLFGGLSNPENRLDTKEDPKHSQVRVLDFPRCFSRSERSSGAASAAAERTASALPPQHVAQSSGVAAAFGLGTLAWVKHGVIPQKMGCQR